MIVISVTYSMCLVYKFWDSRTFDFSDSNAIVHCRSADFNEILSIFIFISLHSQEHPMQGMMV